MKCLPNHHDSFYFHDYAVYIMKIVIRWAMNLEDQF